ncbi:hypothetical protein KM043_008625 [Ampulex compressa]|nr:hypothetical protein KM043_008625 [Ampulex compressa]
MARFKIGEGEAGVWIDDKRGGDGKLEKMRKGGNAGMAGEKGRGQRKDRKYLREALVLHEIRRRGRRLGDAKGRSRIEALRPTAIDEDSSLPYFASIDRDERAPHFFRGGIPRYEGREIRKLSEKWTATKYRECDAANAEF